AGAPGSRDFHAQMPEHSRLHTFKGWHDVGRQSEFAKARRFGGQFGKQSSGEPGFFEFFFSRRSMRSGACFEHTSLLGALKPEVERTCGVCAMAPDPRDAEFFSGHGHGWTNGQ